MDLVSIIIAVMGNLLRGADPDAGVDSTTDVDWLRNLEKDEARRRDPQYPRG